MARSESHMSAVCRILATYDATRPSTPKMEANKKLAELRLSRLEGPSFGLFPQLPTELRDLVFKFAALNAAQARPIIYVEIQVEYLPGKQRCDLTFTVLKSWDKKLDAFVRDLSLSEVNRECRKEYRKVFKYRVVADNGDYSTSHLQLSDSDVVYITNLADFIDEIYNSQLYPHYPFAQASVKHYFTNLQHLAIPYNYLRPHDPETTGPVWSTIESSFACFPNLKRLDLINEAGRNIHRQIDRKHDVLNWMEEHRDEYAAVCRTQMLGEGCTRKEVEEVLASEEWAAFIAKTYPEMRVLVRNWRGMVRLPPTLPGELFTSEGIIYG
ncbi:hypothetical protein BKA64DRAFT_744315 [Cadophora sp. MPI-SDFR-AT-0126]|nr:hypothetical protein BKA64DRAFT_744315 [Leotiomycetes sp. MPI-SDFR-AT-0126]